MRHSMQNLQHTDKQSYESATLKEQQLREIFRELGSVVVAYSGGVDSSYVAYVANAELGERAICITGQSASVPSYQQAEIERVVSELVKLYEKWNKPEEAAKWRERLEQGKGDKPQ